MLLDDDEHASGAGYATPKLEIPPVVGAAASGAATGSLDCFFNRAQSLLRVEPRFVPLAAAPTERDHDPRTGVAPPRS
jgi:hypothetical protein